MRKRSKFVFEQTEPGWFNWRFVAPNGRAIVVHGYRTMYGAKRGAGAFIKGIGAFLNGYIEQPRDTWVAERLYGRAHAHGSDRRQDWNKCGPVARTPSLQLGRNGKKPHDSKSKAAKSFVDPVFRRRG